MALWWKTRYLRLTASFLTVTDLKQRTLLASIPTPEFVYCAAVKTRRAPGRRFLLRLLDNSVLQLCALTERECVQWVSVINGVISVCEKQRAKNTLAWQRRKEQGLRAATPAFALSSPELSDTSQQSSSTSLSSTLPMPLTAGIPAPPTPGRAQTASSPHLQSSAAGSATGSFAPLPVITAATGEGQTAAPLPALLRASSTGKVMDLQQLERRDRRRTQEWERGRAVRGDFSTAERGKRDAEEKAAPGMQRGRGEKELRHRSGRENGRALEERGSRRSRVPASTAAEAGRRRDDGLYDNDDSESNGNGDADGVRWSRNPLYDERRAGERGTSREASDDDYAGRRRSDSRRRDEPAAHYWPPSALPSPGPFFPYVAYPPPLPAELPRASGPPPTQRLLAFLLLFLLFSFAILASGHTFRTSRAVRALYNETVAAPSAPLHAYHLPLSQLLHSWPLFGLAVSGTYLAYLLQHSIRDSKHWPHADSVDWMGGSAAAVVSTACLYAVTSNAKDWLDAWGWS